MNIIKKVTIFGGAATLDDTNEFNNAYETAAALAAAGLTIVDGGGPGIMLAAIKGAKSRGGTTEAVYLEPDYATAFEGREAEVKADTVHSEKNYVERTRRLMELGDAYVFFNGGTGTLSELGLCWCIARLYLGYNKPIILFGKFWEEIIEVLTKRMHIRPSELRVIDIATKPNQVLEKLELFEELIESDRNTFIKNPGAEAELMLGPK